MLPKVLQKQKLDRRSLFSKAHSLTGKETQLQTNAMKCCRQHNRNLEGCNVAQKRKWAIHLGCVRKVFKGKLTRALNFERWEAICQRPWRRKARQGAEAERKGRGQKNRIRNLVANVALRVRWSMVNRDAGDVDRGQVMEAILRHVQDISSCFESKNCHYIVQAVFKWKSKCGQGLLFFSPLAVYFI